ANAWGRRPLLILCFAALALRGALFAVIRDPSVVIAIQVLDGISAAVLGILVPLVVADIMGRSGRFNLALGTVGTAVGIGAAISTTLAGYAMDHFGGRVTFALLTAVAVCGLSLAWLMLPETRPDADRTEVSRYTVLKRLRAALKAATSRGRGVAAPI